MKKYYIIPVFVPHLGCPHDCVFCNQSNITGQDRENANKINYDYVKKVASEYLETIDKEFATVELSFFGGTFTAIDTKKQIELLRAAKELKDEGKIDFIRCSTRPDYIDIEILSRMKEYSMDTIELGVQSLDDEVLRLSGRGHDSKSVERASFLINKFNIKLAHQIMPGLVGDTFNKVIDSVKKSIKMNPKEVRLYPALVIKDTAMEEMYKDKTFKPLTLDEAVEITSILKIMYEENNIKVIRTGLQPTDNLTYDKDLIAGPYHPAFGELVESKIINDKLMNVIKENISKLEENTSFNPYFKKRISRLDLYINEKQVSKLNANGKKYFIEMKKSVNSIIEDLEVKIFTHVDKKIEMGILKVMFNDEKKTTELIKIS